MNPAARDVDLLHLHPVYRAKAQAVLAQLAIEQIPFEIFEAFRYPERQLYLFNQHPPVTHARPWQSYHQYGVAADYVLRINGQWSWDTSGIHGAWWNRLAEIGRAQGLEPLSFERPHLQLAGFTWQALHNGLYPADGDESWATNLETAIVGWHGWPTAPRVPSDIEITRPPLPVDQTAPTAPLSQPEG